MPIDMRLKSRWKPLVCHSPGAAVCAAEALSIVACQTENVTSKRLRLTMGNYHGIAALLDQARLDPNHDKAQLDLMRKKPR